jgi:hypothetical protein
MPKRKWTFPIRSRDYTNESHVLVFNATPINVGFDTLEGFSTVHVRDGGVETIKTNLLRVSEGYDGFWPRIRMMKATTIGLQSIF